MEAADGIHVEGEDNREHLQADRVILACGVESSWALAGSSRDEGSIDSREGLCSVWLNRPLEENASS